VLVIPAKAGIQFLLVPTFFSAKAEAGFQLSLE
jgi:hypothetical protein